MLPNDKSKIQLTVAFSEDKGSRLTMEDIPLVDMDGRSDAQRKADLNLRCVVLGCDSVLVKRAPTPACTEFLHQ